MATYSKDLRERVVQAVDAGEGTQEQIARRFSVSARVDPQAPGTGGSPPARSPRSPTAAGASCRSRGEAAEALRAAVRDGPRRHARRSSARRPASSGCLMTVWRAIERLNITRKKKSLRARSSSTRRSSPSGGSGASGRPAIDPDRFVFLDESNAKTTMTRAYGRAPRGERVVDHVPAGKYHSTTMMGAVRLDGTVAAMVYEGGTDVPVMQAFAGDGTCGGSCGRGTSW